MTFENCDLCGRRAELITFEKDVQMPGNYVHYRGDVCRQCFDREQKRFDSELDDFDDNDVEPF